MTYRDDAERVVGEYGTIVYRVCRVKLASFDPSLADDAYQNTFLSYIEHPPKIEPGSEHEKAWLIVTASNLCRDTLKKWWHRTEDIDDPSLGLQQSPFEIDGVLDVILKLPADQKTVVYMYYYEGYGTSEIAEYLRCPHATVRSRLSRARKTLKRKLGGDF
jgi:RNA polymerase sigma-70 factor (ECF subfamily)